MKSGFATVDQCKDTIKLLKFIVVFIFVYFIGHATKSFFRDDISGLLQSMLAMTIVILPFIAGIYLLMCRIKKISS